MRWNPILNAICASAYIVAIASLMQFISSVRHDTPDTIFDAMGFLSLLVMSVAVMGFLFFYNPIVLILENKRAEAATYFLKTLGTFAVITVIVIAVMLGLQH